MKSRKITSINICGRAAGGKSTALIKMGITLCESDKDIIYVTDDCGGDFLRRRVLEFTTNKEKVEEHFNYLLPPQKATMNDILEFIRKEFQNKLDGAILIIDDLYFVGCLENLSKQDMYKMLSLKVSIIKDFCYQNGIVPIISTSAILTSSRKSGVELIDAQSIEKRMGVRWNEMKLFHTKVIEM